MNVLTLSQLQFGITVIYHFFFVPLTLGLSILVAIMETIYVRTGKEIYRDMTRFWGKLFLINFAMGVVTGIVMEFQFGMNWSEYARFVGDIFGAPLAIEALLAFFLESVFLGVWIFGWDRLPRGVHAAAIWLVALGGNVSALWILAANSFMQEPVGYSLQAGRAVMVNFWSLLGNPQLWVQFPHTVLAGFTTGAFFVLGISAYHLYRQQHVEVFRRSFKIASIFGAAAVLLVLLVGHRQAQHMVVSQPMKIAAAEALWETEDPASFSLLTIVDEANGKDIFTFRLPKILSLIAFNRLEGEIKGLNNLQAEYEQRYGPGDYIPPITVSYWSFRVMVGLGFLMLAVVFYSLYHLIRRLPFEKFPLLKYVPLAIAFPYLANTTGWLLTEIGRQPWIVFGLMKTEDAFSPGLTPGMVLTTLIGFTFVYAALIAADVYLLSKFARLGLEQPESHVDVEPDFEVKVEVQHGS
jgi:cytochrome d ubiquinol oxidase subunit I